MRSFLISPLVRNLVMLIIVVMGSLLFLSSDVFAQIPPSGKQAACQAIGGGCDNTAKTGVNNLLKTAVDILSWVVGIISVIMVIVGGLKFITSGGDANSASSAKRTVAYALVGLAVAALAQVLTRFVISRVK